MEVYNSLTDKFLADYFSGMAVRNHLRKAGLVTRDGYVVPEREYQKKVVEESRRKKELYLEFLRKRKERAWQVERARKLAVRAKQEELQRKKCRLPSWKQISRQSSTSNPVLNEQTQSPAPSVMFQSLPDLSPPQLTSPDNLRPTKPKPQKQEEDRNRCLMGPILGLTSKQLRRSATRLCPTTEVILRPPATEQPEVIIHFRGRRESRHKPGDAPHIVRVEQQPRHGLVMIVYEGKVNLGDNLRFKSRRAPNEPFCLTIWLDHFRHARVNSCCESKRLGDKLGGPGGQFVLVGVDKAKPCFECKSSKDHVVLKHKQQLEKLKWEQAEILNTDKIPVQQKFKRQEKQVDIPQDIQGAQEVLSAEEASASEMGIIFDVSQD